MKFFDKDGPSPKASRAPHGARGLKSKRFLLMALRICRAPHGARGLKCVEHGKRLPCVRVAPRTGRVD